MIEPPLEPIVHEPERYPFWGWIDVILLAGLALPMMLFATTVVWVAGHMLPPLPHVSAARPVAATFLFYGLWFLSLYALIRVRYDRPFWRSLAWVAPPRGVLNAVGWGLAVALASIGLGALLRPPEVKTLFDELLKDPVSIALVGFFALTLGPLCEELAFRGFLMPLLVGSFGPLAGALLAALPFALLHGFEYAWSWQRLVPIFLAGSAFGWMRYRSGSTAAATIMHCAYNLVPFAGLVIEKVGWVR
jgi:membrane protease YdiL (CAAX protease family)